MGCCGGRRDEDDLSQVKAEQKWDYIVSASNGTLYLSCADALVIDPN